MRIETRQRTVDYDVYITNDGKEFTIKSQAEDHEKHLNGTRKKCVRCDGRGRINYREEGVDEQTLKECFAETQYQAIVNTYSEINMILHYPDGYEFIANLNQEGVTVGKKFLPMPDSAFADCESLRHLSEWKYQIKKKGRHCDCDNDFCTHDFILRLQDPNGTTWESIYTVSNGAGVHGFGETLEFIKVPEKV